MEETKKEAKNTATSVTRKTGRLSPHLIKFKEL